MLVLKGPVELAACPSVTQPRDSSYTRSVYSTNTNTNAKEPETDDLATIYGKESYHARSSKMDVESGNSSTSAGVEPVPYVFHLSTQWDYDASKISKNLEDSAPVGDLTRSKDNVLLFQLAHPAPLKPTYISTKESSSTYVTYMDLYVATVKQNDPYRKEPKLTCAGRPIRFNVTVETTARQLYDLVHQCVQRYTKPDSPFYSDPANRPFTLVTSNIWATTVKAEIAEDDTPLNVQLGDVVVAVWRSEADTPEHFNNEEFRKFQSIDSDDDDEDGNEKDGEKASMHVELTS